MNQRLRDIVNRIDVFWHSITGRIPISQDNFNPDSVRFAWRLGVIPGLQISLHPSFFHKGFLVLNLETKKLDRLHTSHIGDLHRKGIALRKEKIKYFRLSDKKTIVNNSSYGTTYGYITVDEAKNIISFLQKYVDDSQIISPR